MKSVEFDVSNDERLVMKKAAIRRLSLNLLQFTVNEADLSVNRATMERNWARMERNGDWLDEGGDSVTDSAVGLDCSLFRLPSFGRKIKTYTRLTEAVATMNRSGVK